MMYKSGIEKEIAPYVPIPKGGLKDILFVLLTASFFALVFPVTPSLLNKATLATICIVVFAGTLYYAGLLCWLGEYYDRNIRGYTAYFYVRQGATRGESEIRFLAGKNSEQFYAPGNFPPELTHGPIVPIRLGGWGTGWRIAHWFRDADLLELPIRIRLVSPHEFPFTVVVALRKRGNEKERDAEDVPLLWLFLKKNRVMEFSFLWILDILESHRPDQIACWPDRGWSCVLWETSSARAHAEREAEMHKTALDQCRDDVDKFSKLRELLTEAVQEILRSSRLKQHKEGNAFALNLVRAARKILTDKDPACITLQAAEDQLLELAPKA